MAYGRGCGAQRVAFLSSCTLRSDDTDARREARRRFGRSDRRAQGDRPTLRSIRPKRPGLPEQILRPPSPNGMDDPAAFGLDRLVRPWPITHGGEPIRGVIL